MFEVGGMGAAEEHAMQPFQATLLAIALAYIAHSPALAQQQPYVEKAYNPPVGSRWIIQSDTKAVEHRAAGEERNQQTSTRSELTIDQKLADGYRVSYVSREIKVTGNTPVARVLGDVFGAMKDVVIRARTDASGKPVEVENLDEVKTALKQVVEAMTAKFHSNPQAGAFVRDMLLKMFDVPAKEAARVYLDELPQLAAAQNSGLKPGQARRERDDLPSPFGGAAVQSELVTRLESWDDKTGQVTIVRTREIDPESLKQMTLGAARQLAKVGDQNAITPEVLKAMKSVTFSMAAETRYLVENGATRTMSEREITTVTAMGTTLGKEQDKHVTVTPLK
jgi:hypothetical protein